MIGRGPQSVLFVLSVAYSVRFIMDKENIRDALLSTINAYYASVKTRVPAPAAAPVAAPVAAAADVLQLGAEMKAKHKNVRSMVLRTISKIDALDHQTSTQLSNLVSRMDDMKFDADLTKARLDSHIETSDGRHQASEGRHDASDHRHLLAETGYRLNRRKIAEVNSAVADLRAESEDRQELTNAKIFDVMQHVDDCKERTDALEAGSNAFERRLSSLERGGEDIFALATRFAYRLRSLEIGGEDVASLANSLAERIGTLETGLEERVGALETGMEERLRALEAFVTARSPVQVRPEAYALASQVVQQCRTARGA